MKNTKQREEVPFSHWIKNLLLPSTSGFCHQWEWVKSPFTEGQMTLHITSDIICDFECDTLEKKKKIERQMYLY